MSNDNDFWERMGMTSSDEEGENEENFESKKIGATAALKELVSMCSVIRSEAMDAGFSSEEAYEMAMTYYSLFLSTNFMAAQAQAGSQGGQG